ncbi:hypothetical protein ACEN9J_11860 [Variovorax sp. Varisp41]|uniref:hypothetical protein n=1 Tax=Variovorax sp. Varisp41 TaxID=3243033 RepID=UPI0039B36D0F
MAASEDDDLLPLDTTPIQICGAAVGRLAEVWDQIAGRTGGGQGRFIEEVFGGIWRDGNTGQEFEAEIRRWDEQSEEMRPLGILQAMFVACAFACQGMKAQESDDLNRAWQYTSRCEYWLGIVVGTWSLRSLQGDSENAFAKMGASARHRENREMKAQVLAWYAANAGTVGSKDAAAEAIAGKLVPVKFRTVRDWLKGA